MKSPTILAAVWAVGIAIPTSAEAHGGGLNAEGCHNDRKNGGYHCHRAPAAPAKPAPNRPVTLKAEPPPKIPAGAYANCTAARAAGAAPVRRGQPGYGAHLDRDGDGVGCE